MAVPLSLLSLWPVLYHYFLYSNWPKKKVRKMHEVDKRLFNYILNHCFKSKTFERLITLDRLKLAQLKSNSCCCIVRTSQFVAFFGTLCAIF